MTKCSKDTLENLIFGEMQRLTESKENAVKTGNNEHIEYWEKEIDDLKKLDAEIWKEIK
jgi:hypothetical protein